MPPLDTDLAFDTEVVLGLIRGDASAGERVFDVLNPQLCRHVRRMGVPPQDVDDVTHDTFIRIRDAVSHL